MNNCYNCNSAKIYDLHFINLFQRNSISPAEREKYRPRTPQEPEMKKPKKEEKDLGHVSIKVRRFLLLIIILSC